MKKQREKELKKKLSLVRNALNTARKLNLHKHPLNDQCTINLHPMPMEYLWRIFSI